MFPAHVADPLAPVNWRWRRARFLADHDRRFELQNEDPLVRQAARFLRGSPAQPASASRGTNSLTSIREAYALARGDHLRLWEIQARMLAREPYHDIARKCGTSEEVLSCFAALFFDVLGSESHPAHTVLVVIDRFNPWSGPPEEKLLKLYAFFLGPLIIDPFLRAIRKPLSLRELCQQVQGALTSEAYEEVMCRIPLLAETLPCTRSNQRRFLRLLHVCLERQGGDINKDMQPRLQCLAENAKVVMNSRAA